MGLLTAFKVFFKALGNGERAEKLLKELSSTESVVEKKVEHKKKEVKEHSHLRLLSLLQQSGRLVDFFQEDISSFTDAQVGAAVRKIHEECGKSLEDLVTIRPLCEEKEGAKIEVPRGYDPSEFKVVGNVSGEPPFTGTLIHKGWKAHKHSLPKRSSELKQEVISPAEIEVR